MFKEDDFITNRNREGNEEYPKWKDLTEGYINMPNTKVDALKAELKLGIDLKLHQVENSMEIIKQDINDLRRHFKMSNLTHKYFVCEPRSKTPDDKHAFASRMAMETYARVIGETDE
ncbi:hypothetical protein LCGC14_2532620, partial [marine sediment metagenome]